MSIKRRITDRENAFVTLFASSFGDATTHEVLPALQQENADFTLEEFGQKLLSDYNEHALQVDKEIESKLKGWRVERLSKVSLSILRLAVTEMLYGEPDMDSVIINEAVELSKKYGDEKDYQFVNGVLGSISRTRSAGEEAEQAQLEKPEADTLPAKNESVMPLDS